MQYTNHYNLNLPEGSDIVNPLVQDNPNYSAIDTALYDNKVRTVGNATEVKSGTVHAITRSDADIDVMRFTATGDWITGDTMTVDGSPVSIYLSDGTAPLTGAYVINTEVMAAVNGSRVTLYVGAGVTSLDAADVNYDNSTSGLTANNAQAALDELSESQNIKYDNTVSGLAATDVQAALDELATVSGGSTRKFYNNVAIANPTAINGLQMSYGDLNIAADVAAYGTPVAICAIDNAAIPCVCSYNPTNMVRIVSMSAYSSGRSARVWITYASDCNDI